MYGSKNIGPLAKKIREAREAYYNGDPIMSDYEFDQIVEQLAKLSPTHEALFSVGAPPSSASTGEHRIPMGSLDKCKDWDELRRWWNDEFPAGGIVIMDKLDGCSVSLDYKNGKLVRALTRGDGKTGEIVTDNVRRMHNVKTKLPGKFTGTLRGEVIMTRGCFASKYADDFANPRNTTAGILRRKSGEGSENVWVLYFDILNGRPFNGKDEALTYIAKTLGLQTVGWTLAVSEKRLRQTWELMEHDRDDATFECDGAVLQFNDPDEATEKGTPLLPGHSRAFKFPPDVKKTKVKDVRWEAGRTGRVNPVLDLAPVKIAGVTVTHATGNNFEWMRDLGIGIGATVMVSRRGDVIPAVEKVVKSGRVLAPPVECPACDEKLEESGKFFLCPNAACPAKTSGVLAHWLNLIDVKGIGPAAVGQLIEMDLTTPADLYRLSRSEWRHAFGRNGEKMYDELHARKQVPLEVVFATFVPRIGRRMFRKLIKAGLDTPEAILDATEEDILAVRGFKARAAEIVKHVKEQRPKILALLKCVSVQGPVKPKAGAALAGYGFKFTGKMVNKRKELEARAEEAGAEVGWNGKLKNVLVIADPNSQSTKAKAARAKGYEIISEEAFLDRVNG